MCYGSITHCATIAVSMLGAIHADSRVGRHHFVHYKETRCYGQVLLLPNSKKINRKSSIVGIITTLVVPKMVPRRSQFS